MRRAIFSLVLIQFCIPLTPTVAGDASPPDKAVAGLEQSGAQEKALEELKNRFGLFPYDESTRKKLIKAYAAMGEKQLKSKLFDEAAESFENARKLSPENQDYGVLKGIALYGGKHYDAAIVELEQARRNGGDTLPILLYLGRTYYDTGELAKAVEVWDMALALEPGNKPIRDMTDKARREMSIESHMDRDYGSKFVISYDEGTRSDLADAVLDALEGAYNRVGYDLSHYPDSNIPVILYTKKDYRSVTSGPEWSGGLYDGKVRLPIGGTREITPLLRGVLSHEYTHVVVGELTKGNCPVWLNEGLAEFEGRKEFDTPLNDLEHAVKTVALIPFKTLEKSIASLDSGKAALAYQQSYSLVSFMISTYGMYKVRDILINLGKGMGSEEAIAVAFADYRLDLEGILQEWREHIRKTYGSD
ncbi:MAG TPA: peptidase MA family metallohydrolase [Geobacteraceae bacterium]|nr:peptidase MA family metallohydrolase [Geobacteraceae bacterium]